MSKFKSVIKKFTPRFDKDDDNFFIAVGRLTKQKKFFIFD